MTRAVSNKNGRRPLGPWVLARVIRSSGAARCTRRALFALDSTPPSIVHRLRLGQDEALLTVGAREAKTLGSHAGLRELRATLEALSGAVPAKVVKRAAPSATAAAEGPRRFAHITPVRPERPLPESPANADLTSPIESLRDVAYGAVALDALRGAVDDDAFEQVEAEVEDFLEEFARPKKGKRK